MYRINNRSVNVFQDTEDGGWVAEVPSLPGCVSQGETKEQALENVKQAMEQWIDAAKRSGRQIPKPS